MQQPGIGRSGGMNRGLEVCSVIISMVISIGYCSTIFWYVYGQISRGEALVLHWIGHCRIGQLLIVICVWIFFPPELISSFALVVRQF